MKDSVAKYLEAAAREMGIRCDVDREYKGHTSAVVIKITPTLSMFDIVSNRLINKIIAVAAMSVKEDEEHDKWVSCDDFVDALGNVNIDVLKDSIVYY